MINLLYVSLYIKFLGFSLSRLADIYILVFSNASHVISTVLIAAFNEMERLACALIFTRISRSSFFI